METFTYHMQPIILSDKVIPRYSFDFFFANTSGKWFALRMLAEDPDLMISEIARVKSLKRITIEMNTFHQRAHAYLKNLYDNKTKFSMMLEFYINSPNGKYRGTYLSLKGVKLTKYGIIKHEVQKKEKSVGQTMEMTFESAIESAVAG